MADEHAGGVVAETSSGGQQWSGGDDLFEAPLQAEAEEAGGADGQPQVSLGDAVVLPGSGGEVQGSVFLGTAGGVAEGPSDGEDERAGGEAPGAFGRSYSWLDGEFMASFQAKAPGFRPKFGGEELQRAFAALGGPALLTPPEGQLQAEQPGGSTPKGKAQGSPAPKVPLPPLLAREAGDARSRELVFAAKRHSAAAITNPDDFHAHYNHGLVLQELASVKGRRPVDQERLLLEACECYGAALTICRSAHAVLYNWGVALTDLAKLAKMNGSGEMRQYLYTAGEKYAAALRWNPRNPQALNNLGLVLQDLSLGLPLPQRQKLMGWAAEKFRRAMRLRPDFHRSAYNLGTVYYAHAAALGHHQWPGTEGAPSSTEGSVDALFQMAAQYVCLAFALEPYKEVYQSSYAVVRAQLPLPYLRSGYLRKMAPGPAPLCQERWVRNWYVLDEQCLAEVEAPRIEEHRALRKEALVRTMAPHASAEAATTATTAAGPSGSGAPTAGAGLIRVPMHNVLRVQRCFDPSLPAGGALWLQLRDSEAGMYLVAEGEEEAECWVDALLLVAFLVEQRREEALASALSRSVGGGGASSDDSDS